MQTAKLALQRRGYRVLTAQNGRDGVDLFSARPGEISLVILDMTMPVMGGVEALAALHATHPGVRVLGSSGYSEQEALQQFGSGLAAFLQKPYTVRQLCDCVATVLTRWTRSPTRSRNSILCGSVVQNVEQVEWRKGGVTE